MDAVRNAWNEQDRARRQMKDPRSETIDYSYVREVWTDFIIVEREGPNSQCVKVPYEVGQDGSVEFAEQTPVRIKYVELSALGATLLWRESATEKLVRLAGSRADKFIALAGSERVSGYQRTSSFTGKTSHIGAYTRSPGDMGADEIEAEIAELGDMPARASRIENARRRTREIALEREKAKRVREGTWDAVDDEGSPDRNARIAGRKQQIADQGGVGGDQGLASSVAKFRGLDPSEQDRVRELSPGDREREGYPRDPFYLNSDAEQSAIMEQHASFLDSQKASMDAQRGSNPDSFGTKPQLKSPLPEPGQYDDYEDYSKGRKSSQSQDSPEVAAARKEFSKMPLGELQSSQDAPMSDDIVKALDDELAQREKDGVGVGMPGAKDDPRNSEGPVGKQDVLKSKVGQSDADLKAKTKSVHVTKPDAQSAQAELDRRLKATAPAGASSKTGPRTPEEVAKKYTVSEAADNEENLAGFDTSVLEENLVFGDALSPRARKHIQEEIARRAAALESKSQTGDEHMKAVEEARKRAAANMAKRA